MAKKYFVAWTSPNSSMPWRSWTVRARSLLLAALILDLFLKFIVHTMTIKVFYSITVGSKSEDHLTKYLHFAFVLKKSITSRICWHPSWFNDSIHWKPDDSCYPSMIWQWPTKLFVMSQKTWLSHPLNAPRSVYCGRWREVHNILLGFLGLLVVLTEPLSCVWAHYPAALWMCLYKNQTRRVYLVLWHHYKTALFWQDFCWLVYLLGFFCKFCVCDEVAFLGNKAWWIRGSKSCGVFLLLSSGEACITGG